MDSPQPTILTERRWLLRLLDPITMLCTTDALWTHAPHWLNNLCQRYLIWFLDQTHGVRMQQAEQQGIGRTTTWLPPGTDAATVVAWFEQQVMIGRRPMMDGTDMVFCAFAPCAHDPQDRSDAAAPATSGMPVTAWHDLRRAWWTEGAALMAAQVPADHPGLFLQVTQVRDLFEAALIAPQTRSPALARERSAPESRSQ